ncbi:hypothetical protein AMAG_17873 [Allomyces macrogynus ATCC 38327]|uniref:Rad60/SUMO-like domain-containing protein n=1 Tax=Allomyces macrogynus (strain ATCC 38327) TaxID=578462 RepID=A0A0L0S0I2_ALLM3|nr:hypothetical protein AMAG_17873 [Allomyces macrogynus ATCC 38327]|eukprot:KNE56127.1 hypothetical protein AMAG_17873 [Allomyces macrogynus ATCC 38327]
MCSRPFVLLLHPPTQFKVKSTTKFQKIAKAYADKKNIDVSTLRFYIDGEPAVAERTVGELDLINGNIVDWK